MYILLAIISLLIILSYSSQEYYNNYSNYARKHDEMRRHFTKPGWVPKIHGLPPNSPYYDSDKYIPNGIIVHTRNEEFRLPLWMEKNPSGGGVVFNYLVKKAMGGRTIPLQTDKELNNEDLVSISGYPGQFRVYIYSLANPYTFQVNVIGSRGGPIPFKTAYY